MWIENLLAWKRFGWRFPKTSDLRYSSSYISRNRKERTRCWRGKSPYADTLVVSFPGQGCFLLTILVSLVSVSTYEDLLLLNGHFYLLPHFNFHPMAAPAHNHVFISVLENGNIQKTFPPSSACDLALSRATQTFRTKSKCKPETCLWVLLWTWNWILPQVLRALSELEGTWSDLRFYGEPFDTQRLNVILAWNKQFLAHFRHLNPISKVKSKGCVKLGQTEPDVCTCSCTTKLCLNAPRQILHGIVALLRSIGMWLLKFQSRAEQAGEICAADNWSSDRGLL